MPIILGIMLMMSNSYAGILALNSRIIYPQDMKSQTLMLVNRNQYPIITQTWVDDGLGDPNQAKAPFVVLPAVFKLNPQGIQALRIIHNGDTMPLDRESVFWLNLYEIPGKTPEQIKPLEEGQTRLNLAINTQLKVFYRPTTLKEVDIKKIIQQLQFSIQHQKGQTLLICINPTAYHISFTNLSVIQAGKEIRIRQEVDMMTPPLDKRIYHLESPIPSTNIDKIKFTVLDDQGYGLQAIYNSETRKISIE